MRRLLPLLLLLTLPPLVKGQNLTTVTSTVVDPNGTAFAFGTYSIILYNPNVQQPLYGGLPLPLSQRSYTGQLDINGALSVKLPSNAIITPTGTQWTFNICANTAQITIIYPPPTLPCFSSNQTISGATQSITFTTPIIPTIGGTSPAAADAVRYVSAVGNDTNNGLSPGTPKATVYGALLSLPGGGAGFAGSGTVYVGPNSSANPTAGAGIWLMGSLDPNYASPPTGWLKCNACAVNLIGNGTTSPGYAFKPITVPMTAGSTADRNHPSVWLSNLNQNFNVSNISFSGSQRSIVIGECSNNDRTTCVTFGGLLDRVDVNVSIINASSGPGIDLAAATFQEIRNGSCTGSTGAVVVYTADNAACILQVGGGLRITNEELFHGGVKVTGLGANPGQFVTYATNVDEYGDNTNTQPPVVWFTNFGPLSDAVLVNVSQQFGNATVGAVRIDGTSTVSGPGPIVIGGAGVAVVGPATILADFPYYYSQASNKAIFNRQTGFITRYMLGETDVARRIAGLVPVRFANKSDTNSANWTSAGNTITLAQTDPFGGTGAAKFHTVITPGGQNAVFGATTAYTPAINDWIVGGAWVKGGIATGVGLLSPGVTFTTQINQVGMDVGDGNEWMWQYFAYKVAANAGATTLQLYHQYLSTGDIYLYGPSLYILPAASVSDDEALWFANSAGSIDKVCAAGSICNLTGHPIQLAPDALAALGTPTNGTVTYCSDCTIANPCAGGGTGAIAKRLNGAWVCN